MKSFEADVESGQNFLPNFASKWVSDFALLLKVAAVFWTGGPSDRLHPVSQKIQFARFKMSIGGQDAIFAETYLDQKWWQGSQFGKSLIWPVNISLWCHGWSTVVDKTKQSIYRKTKQQLTKRKMTLVGSQSLKTLLSKENGWVVTQNPNNQPGRYKFVYCIELSLLLVPVLLFLPP